DIPLDVSALPELVAQKHQSQILHKPVKVPKHRCPFDMPESLQIFEDTLHQATTNDLIPDGYGLTPEEWDEDRYPELWISLAFAVWKPRADMWGQALYIMNSLLFGEDGPDEEEPLFLPGSSDDDDDRLE
ncbi:hypothetical protein C8J56DRAFT_786004, partial [Mycena floridula]